MPRRKLPQTLIRGATLAERMRLLAVQIALFRDLPHQTPPQYIETDRHLLRPCAKCDGSGGSKPDPCRKCAGGGRELVCLVEVSS